MLIAEREECQCIVVFKKTTRKHGGTHAEYAIPQDSTKQFNLDDELKDVNEKNSLMEVCHLIALELYFLKMIKWNMLVMMVLNGRMWQ